jgi:hypothetical protein
MSDQEILVTVETEGEPQTLFDELAGLVPEVLPGGVLQSHRTYTYAQPQR